MVLPDLTEAYEGKRVLDLAPGPLGLAVELVTTKRISYFSVYGTDMHNCYIGASLRKSWMVKLMDSNSPDWRFALLPSGDQLR